MAQQPIKQQGIVTNGGVSFTSANIATYLAANYIEPLQYYLVDGRIYWAKPDPTSSYTSRSGSKYSLTLAGGKASDIKIKVGANEFNLPELNAKIEIATENFVAANVNTTTGVVTLGIDATGAQAGQHLQWDGSAFSYQHQYVRSESNTNGINLAVDQNGDLSATLNRYGHADNALKVDGSGVYTLLKGKVGNDVTTSYNATNGELSAEAVISTSAKNLLKGGLGGLVVDFDIHEDSQPYLEFDYTTNSLKVKQLLIKSVSVVGEGTVADQAAADTWLTDELANFQEGDMVMFPAISKSYMRSATAWEQVKVPALTEAAIIAMFSATDGASLDANGVIRVVIDPASTGLSRSASGIKFEYQNVKAYDYRGILGNGLHYETTLHTFITKVAEYAMKMFDWTAENFRMVKKDGSGNVVVGSVISLDNDGAMLVDVYDAGSVVNPFDQTSLPVPF